MNEYQSVINIVAGVLIASGGWLVTSSYASMEEVATEANPIVAPLITHGYFPLVALSIGVYWLMTKYHNATANTVANGVTCGVAASNLLLIK